MTCPACGSSLRERTTAGIALDECTGCSGIWFDGRELEQYRSRLPERPRWTDGSIVVQRDSTRRSCPRCNDLTLQAGTIGGNVAFHCDGCQGTFLSLKAVLRVRHVTPGDASGSFGVLDLVDLVDIDLLDIVFEIIAALTD